MNFLISITELGGDLTSADGAKAAAIKVARSLFYLINSLIYEIITNLYTLFEYICNARLLQSEQFQSISEKIGLILGMIMLFRVIFNFIQILLDPDKINDKEIGAVSIIKKFLIVIVMLGCSSFFFNTMFHIQKFILNEKVIYKLILPSDQTIDTENFGAVLSARTFTTFYNVNNTLLSESISEAEQCNSYRNLLINRIVQNNDFSTGNYCLTAWGNVNVSDAKGNTQQISAFIMDYNFVLQFAVGLALVYLLFMYALKVGVRVIQLTVLQIISPMAIVSYLSPKKDNMFSKWWKIYFSTYIDAFIRVAIIYFVVYLSSILLDTIERGTNTFWESVGDPTDTYTRTVFIIAMILALLTFAKKAPDLIKELLPASASKLGFGLSSPKTFLKDLTSSPLAVPMKVAAAPIGLLAKKTLGGIDSATAGQGFSKGWGSVHGKFGTWINKQREQYMPYSTERRKQSIEGNKEVTTIDNKWNEGAKIAKKLMQVTKRKTSGVDDGKYSDSNPNAWNKVLNGDSSNKDYYNAIFKNENFIRSKMNVDKESSIEDDLRRGFQQIQAGGDFAWGGTTYGVSHGNVDAFSKIYENQQKKVEGMKNVHESMRKQYQQDAQVEDQFKFIKNNEVNPASPGNTHVNKGIR